MKLLKKLFHLPTPVELGRSESNSLPMEFFSDLENGDNYTWEDYDKEIKAAYPIKFFLVKTLPMWWRVKIAMNISHWWYWFVSHTYRRYHSLDLRQPYTDTEDDYDWGWLDEDRQMLFAMWNVFVSYIETSNKSKFNYGIDDISRFEEEIKESPEIERGALEQQLNFLKEAKSLYEYWTINRKVNLKKKDALLKDWHDHHKEDKRTGDDSRWRVMREFESKFDEEEEQMLIRLIKIRTGLWT